MIATFTLLRALAYLKRLTVAAESIARSQSRLIALAEEPVRVKPKKSEFTQMSAEAVAARMDEAETRRRGGIRP